MRSGSKRASRSRPTAPGATTRWQNSWIVFCQAMCSSSKHQGRSSSSAIGTPRWTGAGQERGQGAPHLFVLSHVVVEDPLLGGEAVGDRHVTDGVDHLL